MDSKSKGNYNFATKVMSTEKVRNKNVEEVRRKNQAYSFSKLSKILTLITSE